MSPRPYRLGQRQVLTEQTRERILTATRELLMTSDGFSGFSIDAVARQADVARMTVYHQFGSKIGLLEALTDVLAAQGGMQQLASAFRQPDPSMPWTLTSQSSVVSGTLIGSSRVDSEPWPHSTQTSSRWYGHGMTGDDRVWRFSSGGWPASTHARSKQTSTRRSMCCTP